MRYTIEKIKNILLEGYHFKTTVDTTINGGERDWWIVEDEEGIYSFYNFGRGQGWSDQSRETTYESLDEFATAIYHERGKKHYLRLY